MKYNVVVTWEAMFWYVDDTIKKMSVYLMF